MSKHEHIKNRPLAQGAPYTTQDTFSEAGNARQNFWQQPDFLAAEASKKPAEAASANVINFPNSPDNPGHGGTPDTGGSFPTPSKNSEGLNASSNSSFQTNRGRPRKYQHKVHERTMSTVKAVRSRCLRPTDRDYQRYGPKMLCQRWSGDRDRATMYQDLVEEIGPCPSKHHTLDRIDNSRPYEPGNVQWATPKQQARNRKQPAYMQSIADEMAQHWASAVRRYWNRSTRVPTAREINLFARIAQQILERGVQAFTDDGRIKPGRDPGFVAWLVVYNWRNLTAANIAERVNFTALPDDAKPCITVPEVPDLGWLWHNVETLLNLEADDIELPEESELDIWVEHIPSPPQPVEDIEDLL